MADMGTATAGNRPSPNDVSELGEYALEMFEQAGRWARHLQLPDVFERLQAFTISMALWVASHEGQLLTLEPVVDALAQAANSTGESEDLLSPVSGYDRYYGRHFTDDCQRPGNRQPGPALAAAEP